MGGRCGGFKTATLVNGYVYQYRARFHGFEHVARDELGGFGTRDQHCSHDEVVLAYQLADRVFV